MTAPGAGALTLPISLASPKQGLKCKLDLLT